MSINEPSIPHSQLQDAPDSAPESLEAASDHGEIDPDNPPWAADRVGGFIKALLLWIGSVLCLLLVPLILVVPYAVYAYATGHLNPSELGGNKTFLFLSILGVIPAHVVTLLMVWTVVTQWGRYPFWKTLGLTWQPGISPWTTIGVCGGIAVVLLIIGGAITNWFGGEKTQLDELINSSYQARLATAFLAFATGPLVEEIVYRGVVYPGFARLVSVPGAIVLVTIMFAGVHVVQYKNNLAVIGVIAMLSLTLTLVRAYSRSLLPPFIIHLIFNGLQSLYLIVQPFFEKADQATPPAVPSAILIIRNIQHLM